MNNLTIIGRLTADPVCAQRDVAGAKMDVCNFTVAVNSRNSAGNERTDFFKVGMWRSAAVACGAYLKKGTRVAVTGSVSLAQRTYQGRILTDLTVHNARVEFLDAVQQTQEPAGVNADELPPEDYDDDDLPFEQD